jgi:voltage-gated potassium channel
LRLLGGGAGLRLLRLARASTFSVEAMRKLIRSMMRRGLFGVAVMIVAVALVGALLVVGFERNSTGNIKSIGDAIWWAIATVSTVGYGDFLPVTVEGRVVAVILMVMGVVFYSILTANLAAFFVETTSEGEETATRKSFEELGQKLESIEQELAALRSGSPISPNGNQASGAAPPLNDDPAVQQPTERGTG